LISQGIAGQAEFLQSFDVSRKPLVFQDFGRPFFKVSTMKMELQGFDVHFIYSLDEFLERCRTCASVVSD
jgi:hypothetical protein